MLVFLQCYFHYLPEIMNQQTLPDKLVETNAALQCELKANIPIVPNLLPNGGGGGRSSIQKAMIYTILNNTFLFMKPLQFAMSMHPKNHIDKYQDFPLRMKSITFT